MAVETMQKIREPRFPEPAPASALFFLVHLIFGHITIPAVVGQDKNKASVLGDVILFQNEIDSATKRAEDASPSKATPAGDASAAPSSRASLSSSTLSEGQPLCTTSGYTSLIADSTWRFMKRYPSFAPCTVQGLPIEELEPDLNFRRGYALGYDADVEAKDYLEPFLRPWHDPNLAARPRRVLLDLGASYFETSLSWFLRNYPLSFTEIHAFEGVKGKCKVPNKTAEFSFLQVNTSDMGTDGHIRQWRNMGVPDPVLDIIHLRETLVGIEDVPGGERFPGQVNITRFILEELKLSPADTVVIKMDIEGAEWKILPTWLSNPVMPMIVDEIFVEVHYNHPSMSSFKWSTFKHTRDDAFQLLTDLRAKGFFAHSWP